MAKEKGKETTAKKTAAHARPESVRVRGKVVSTHGRTFKGTVIKDVFHKTTTIEFPRQIYISKFERFEKRRTRVKVHVPAHLSVTKGDLVVARETRPISKTKNFVVVEVTKQ